MKTAAKKALAPKKQPKKPSPATKGQSLDEIFDSLKAVLLEYVPPFRTDPQLKTGNKRALELSVPKPVVVPGAYGGKPVHLMFAAAILQKGYVGFYIMCVYTDGPAKTRISPALLKLRKGKSCFQIKAWDEALGADVRAALAVAKETYRERGWLS